MRERWTDYDHIIILYLIQYFNNIHLHMYKAGGCSKKWGGLGFIQTNVAIWEALRGQEMSPPPQNIQIFLTIRVLLRPFWQYIEASFL